MQPATISGTVTRVNGALLVGVCVQLDSNGSPWSPVVHTDSHGAYSITGVTPNQIDPYEVVVDAFCGVGANAANYLPYTSSPGLYVTAGQTVTVNPALTLGGSIAGRVLLQGTLVGGVCISEAGPGVLGKHVTSATDGSYVISAIPAGSVSVEFSVCGGNGSQPNVQPVFYGQNTDGSPSNVVVTAGTQLALPDQALLAGGEIDIKLTDGAANPQPTGVFPVVHVMDPTFQGVVYGWRSSAPTSMDIGGSLDCCQSSTKPTTTTA